MSDTIFQKMIDGILALKKDSVLTSVDAAISTGISAYEIVEKGLTAGMREMGKKFEAGEVYIPHLMVASEIVSKAMAVLTPRLTASQSEEKDRPVALIGTVEGDIHDLGKNLVATMLTCHGVKVIDLGRDVPAARFVEVVKEKKPGFVMLSALMTTTMMHQEKVIGALKEAGVRGGVKVFVGGAPVSQEWANRIGADGYGLDALDAVKLVKHAQSLR